MCLVPNCGVKDGLEVVSTGSSDVFVENVWVCVDTCLAEFG
jgi:hypothetical protein